MINPNGKEIVAIRVAGAIFWNVVLQIALLKCFVLIVNVNISNPFLWLTNVTISIFSLETCIYIIPLIFVTFAQGIVSCREYLFSSVCAKSRFLALKQIFCVYNIVVGFMYVYIGLSIPLIYSTDIEDGYNSFVLMSNGKHYLSENRLFLIFGGMWTGLYYFINDNLFSSKLLSFPFIQQQKAFVIKSTLLPSMKATVKYTVTPVLSYLLLYYFRGFYITGICGNLFGMEVYPGDVSSISNLLTLRRLFYLWMFSNVIILTLKLMEVMIKLFLTQRHIFPFYISATKPPRYFILEEALMRSDIPIIQHLGFLDLVLVSEMDKERRKEIFTLSQPGGHPYTWNGIKKECFYIINTFTASLNEAINKPIKTETAATCQFQPKSRLESTEYFMNSNPTSPLLCTETLTVIIRSVRKFLVDWILTKVKTFMEMKVMKYFFGEVSEFRVNHLLLHSMPVVWASESLSFLVCCSLVEDDFGIIQNDIPQIISYLLKLKSSIECLTKQTGVRKCYRFDSTITKRHKALLSAVKRSLYRIALKFKPFVTDLQLAKEDEKQLTSFLSFRE